MSHIVHKTHSFMLKVLYNVKCESPEAAAIVMIVDLACIEEWRNRGDKCMRENLIFDQILPSYMYFACN